MAKIASVITKSTEAYSRHMINYLLYLDIILHLIDLFIAIVRGTVTVCMRLLCNQHLGNDQLNLKGRCCGIIYLHH